MFSIKGWLAEVWTSLWHGRFPLACCFLQFCTEVVDMHCCIYLFMHADVKKIWQSLGFDSSVHKFIFITAYLCPRLQSLQGSLSQECSCEQPHSNSCVCLWWMVVPMIRWPLPQLFQMTPALTWENIVPCNVQWDTRGMILAVRCVSAASLCPSADLWPALRPAPMDMCKYT